MGKDARSDETPGGRRGRRLAASGLCAAMLVGALATHWAWQRVPSAEADPGHFVATDLAPLPPSTSGLVPATAQPRAVRWMVTAADVLGEHTSTPSRLRVVPTPPAPLAAEGPSGPSVATTAGSSGASPAFVVVLAEAVRPQGPAVGEPIARLAGVDVATGHIRWRGPAFGDVADCARTPGGDIACLERLEHAGRLVAVGEDGTLRRRVDLAGRPSALGADPSGFVSVAATPSSAATEVILTRWDAAGTARWSRSYLAAAGTTPGRPRTSGSAVVVEQATVDGAALIVDDRDGALARNRPLGAVVGFARGWPLFDTGGERWADADGPVGEDGGGRRGTPVAVSASDDSVVLPTLTRRFGHEGGHATLKATPAPGAAGRSWSLPGGQPLAACAGQLVLTSGARETQTLRAVGPATGETRWEMPLPGTAPRTAACTPHTVLIPVGNTPGAVAEYDLATGTLRRPMPHPSAQFAGVDGAIDLVSDAAALLTLGADATGAWVALLA